jgi:hypothetical protein
MRPRNPDIRGITPIPLSLSHTTIGFPYPKSVSPLFEEEALRNNFAYQALQSSLSGFIFSKGQFCRRKKKNTAIITDGNGRPTRTMSAYLPRPQNQCQGTITVQMQRINALPNRQSSILFDVVLLYAVSQVFTVHYLRNTISILQADTILTLSSQPIHRRLHHMNN